MIDDVSPQRRLPAPRNSPPFSWGRSLRLPSFSLSISCFHLFPILLHCSLYWCIKPIVLLFILFVCSGVRAEGGSTMQRARINGVELAYELRGAGKPLVMIHGAQGDQSMFNNVIPAFANDFHVLTFDQRGSGLSE